MDAGERYFRENSYDGLLIPFLLSSSLSIWLIEAIFSEAIEFPVDSGIVEFSDWIAFFLGGSQNHLMPFQASFGVGGFIEIPRSLVSGEFPISHIMVTPGCVFDKGLFKIFHAILSAVRTTADLT
ncbi:hypothetical protein Tco_0655070 [Tanacetum coccineum]|uniref:Uncharacterized protein n=1 Tax=Tanacetum coccineum TaxID=301880 RepID=A0ABQ4X632_9ASTR